MVATRRDWVRACRRVGLRRRALPALGCARCWRARNAVVSAAQSGPVIGGNLRGPVEPGEVPIEWLAAAAGGEDLGRAL
ncbi:hypothetical protein NDU88_004493 [Pleurodeles waltl]|uniref:Uncharacterized protein n=1 Tax=Pleurodeles waltl TaxID=8319 RepID=A0AAV7UFV0_PLEWA|nr:hypothetical protein NDU88_004493 [Pleurodeles waltl]